MKSLENINESFQGVVERLPQRRKEVYELIKSNPNITIQEASEKLGKPINEVSGRFTELKEVFLIVELEDKINRRSGFKNTSYVISNLDELMTHMPMLINSYRAQQIMLEDDIENCEYELSIKILEREKNKVERKINKLVELWTNN